MVISSLPVLPSFLFSIVYSRYDYSVPNYFHIISLILLTLGIYLFILRLFVFKTSWLVDKLHLEKGFTEDRIHVNLRFSTLLSLAVIVIGGFWFVENLADFCKEVFAFFQQKSMFKDYPSSSLLIFYFVNTVAGYLIMTNSKSVVSFIEKQMNNRNEEGESKPM